MPLQIIFKAFPAGYNKERCFFKMYVSVFQVICWFRSVSDSAWESHWAPLLLPKQFRTYLEGVRSLNVELGHTFSRTLGFCIDMFLRAHKDSWLERAAAYQEKHYRNF